MGKWSQYNQRTSRSVRVLACGVRGNVSGGWDVSGGFWSRVYVRSADGDWIEEDAGVWPTVSEAQSAADELIEAVSAGDGGLVERVRVLDTEVAVLRAQLGSAPMYYPPVYPSLGQHQLPITGHPNVAPNSAPSIFCANPNVATGGEVRG